MQDLGYDFSIMALVPFLHLQASEYEGQPLWRGSNALLLTAPFVKRSLDLELNRFYIQATIDSSCCSNHELHLCLSCSAFVCTSLVKGIAYSLPSNCFTADLLTSKDIF